jgi:hypothetical protein
MTREERFDLRRQRAFHPTQSLEPARFGQRLAERRCPGALPVRFASAYHEPVPLQSRQPAQAFGSRVADGFCSLRSISNLMFGALAAFGYRRLPRRCVAVP